MKGRNKMYIGEEGRTKWRSMRKCTFIVIIVVILFVVISQVSSTGKMFIAVFGHTYMLSWNVGMVVPIKKVEVEKPKLKERGRSISLVMAGI